VAWSATPVVGEVCPVGAEGKRILPRMNADENFVAAG
jgi:hypothetical protein